MACPFLSGFRKNPAICTIVGATGGYPKAGTSSLFSVRF
jgi:hypothetical protein